MGKYKRYSTKALNKVLQNNEYGLIFDTVDYGVRNFNTNHLEPSTTVQVYCEFEGKRYDMFFTYSSKRNIAFKWAETEYIVQDFCFDRVDKTLNRMRFEDDVNSMETWHKVKFWCYTLLTKYFRMIDDKITIKLVGDIGPHINQKEYENKVNQTLESE